MKRTLKGILYLVQSFIFFSILMSPALMAQSFIKAHDGSVATKLTAQQVLEQRCVVCHGCFSSPCNLKLDSFEGLERGARPGDIYASRLTTALNPMRLGVDAKTTEDWRKAPFNFHSVTETLESGRSIMESLLHHRRFGASGGATVMSKEEEAQLGRHFQFNAEYDRSCVKNQTELDGYLKRSPLYGMPYGMAQLSDEEFQVLQEYLKNGPRSFSTLGGGMPLESSAEALSQIQLWEIWLNQADLKGRLIARYIYEHFYSGHIQFKDSPKREYYRLVRSYSANGPIDEVATARPYDQAKAPFVYRFKRMTETPVIKNHTVVVFSKEKLRRYQELFWNKNFTVDTLPGYGPAGANPFTTFAQIPAQSRYQFMLDDAHYFVKTFIRGPVCHGHVATNVIRDHFVVFFLAPHKDPFVQNAQFQKEANPLLNLPAAGESFVNYTFYKILQRQYQTARYQILKNKTPLTIADLWDGEGHNDQAILTVFRHQTSASVDRGILGPAPKTAWVLDYPIFERIYYDLVAGFNVYDVSSHKIATRRYMDNLRLEGEDLFLSFFRPQDSLALRRYWNQGLGAIKLLLNPIPFKSLFQGMKTKTDVRLKLEEKTSAVDEFLKAARPHFSEKIWTSAKQFNSIPEEFKIFHGHKGPFVEFFPDIIFLQVEQKNGEFVPYTIFRNRERIYANYMFIDGIDPKNDYLSIYQGTLGHFPNVFIRAKSEELSALSAAIQGIKTLSDYHAFLKRYGVHRLDQKFWATSDYFAQYFRTTNPLEAGIFDLTRYQY